MKFRIQDTDGTNERDCEFIVEEDVFYQNGSSKPFDGLRFYELNGDSPKTFVVSKVYTENLKVEVNFSKRDFDDRPIVSCGILIFNEDPRLSRKFKNSMRSLISKCLERIENSAPTYCFGGGNIVVPENWKPNPTIRRPILYDVTVEFSTQS